MPPPHVSGTQNLLGPLKTKPWVPMFREANPYYQMARGAKVPYRLGS